MNDSPFIERMARMETSLERIEQAVTKQTDDQETRLRKVERRQHMIFGAGALVSFLVAHIAGFFSMFGWKA